MLASNLVLATETFHQIKICWQRPNSSRIKELLVKLGWVRWDGDPESS